MKDSTVHLALIILFVIVIRWAISLHPYSGAEKPPMYGDYEAQRHWMEITYNLPVEDWYRNTTDNDLQYWGLDYPPLTAYHSWILGAVSHRLNSPWVELYKSRGHESYDHKLFMRYSVLVVDVLVYVPAVLIYFMRCSCIADRTNQLLFSAIVLLYPGLMLIDYGHFQYNCLSLGLALWGVIGLGKGHDLLGSIAFVLALNYKQMELYHAVPFFCYLFGSCVHVYRKKGLKSGCSKLVKLAAVVLVTFYICWHPFLNSWDLFGQVLHRLFPFARGLFEDKVANVWCSLSLLIKFKQLVSIPSMPFHDTSVSFAICA